MATATNPPRVESTSAVVPGVTNGNALVIAIAVAACLCILVALIACVVIRYRKRGLESNHSSRLPNSTSDSENVEIPSVDSGTETETTSISDSPSELPAPPRGDGGSAAEAEAAGLARLDHWSVAYDQIEKGKELARGNFGVVFQALFRGNECVVKEIIVPEGTVDVGALAAARREMLDEALLMATLKPHGSIATFYGVCIDPHSPLCVLTELVAGGNLHDFLQKSRHVSARDGMSLARDLASGLQHLTETNILHSDVAARNCLLVPNTRPLRLKICDYGLSSEVGPGQKWVEHAGMFPVRWAAPEIYTEPHLAYHFPGSDVWSWGIVVWEIFNHGRIPYDELPTNAQVMEFVVSGGRLELGRRMERDRILAQLASLVEDCWTPGPDARPKFSMVSQKCRKLLGLLDDDSDRSSSGESSACSDTSDNEVNTDAVLQRLQQEASNGVAAMYGHMKAPPGSDSADQGLIYAVRAHDESPSVLSATYALSGAKQARFSDQKDTYGTLIETGAQGK
jgi:serine/threonine protein kinase